MWLWRETVNCWGKFPRWQNEDLGIRLHKQLPAPLSPDQKQQWNREMQKPLPMHFCSFPFLSVLILYIIVSHDGLCVLKGRPQSMVKAKRNNRRYVSFACSLCAAKFCFCSEVMFVCCSLESVHLNLSHYHVSFQVMCANVAWGQWNFRSVKMITATLLQNPDVFLFLHSYAHIAKLDLTLHVEALCIQSQSDSLSSSFVSDKDINPACWMSSCNKKGFPHQIKGQNRGEEKCLSENVSYVSR